MAEDLQPIERSFGTDAHMNPYGETLAERQYLGYAGLNAEIRLGTIDMFVNDGRNFREEMVDSLEIDEYGNKVVLDVGCSNGSMLIDLRSRRNYNGLAIGIDIDNSALLEAEKRISKRDITPIVFIQGDMNDIALKDNSVDSILNSFTLHHADEPLLVLQELWRILKPGGQLVISANDINQKQIHRRLLKLAASYLNIKPPIPFAKNFNTQNATSLLSQFFNVEQTITQESLMKFYSEDTLSRLFDSLITYSSEFSPPVYSRILNRTLEFDIKPKLLEQIANEGSISDNINRAFYICRKSA